MLQNQNNLTHQGGFTNEKTLSYAPSEYDRAFELVGIILKPNSTTKKTLYLEWLYGNYFESGTYRIVKSVIDSRGTGDYDKYYLTAEFKIIEK